ncbi:HNH nuclease [uncultured Caudovirales phage]|uniref:HNH nuclease n=1 Tax=uncultured Caudovirales phage TaxID=2100421 RepID=A0A6J5MCX5_9CAUD|nr:HNH nuclease [uncultured Caudovirales phage]
MRNFWTEQELKFLKDNYSDMQTKDIATILGRKISGVYGKAYELKIGKSKKYMKAMLERESKRLAEFGKNYQFKKGNLPYNYGQKMSKEMYDKLKPTMYKKGNKPTNIKKKGDERIDHEGYTYVKLADSNWVLKHRLIWEDVNGPIPADSIVIFIDKNITNFDIKNLQLITKAENMLRNTIHQYPEPIQSIIKLNNKLKKQINAKQN